jgi:hypothetical protein
MHPLWWLVLPYLAVVGAFEATTYVRTGAVGRWAERPVVRRTGVVLVVALVVVWGARGLGAFGGPVPID